MTLSARDKTPKPFGHNFHHTDPQRRVPCDPQRRVPCVIGDLLAPLSADDIPPITPEAMALVQAALALLAAMISDRDHNLFMGCSQRQAELTDKARDILLTARGLAGILRVEPDKLLPPSLTCSHYQRMGCTEDQDGKAVNPESCYVCGMSATAHRKHSAATENQRGSHSEAEAATSGEVRVCLTETEAAALKIAREYVRVHMAHEHSWEIRDAAMEAIGKVLKAASHATIRSQ